MEMRLHGGVVGMLVFGLLGGLGCGGTTESGGQLLSGGNPGKCPGQSACGGDPVGTWQIAGACQSSSKLPFLLCTDAVPDTSGLTTTGSITYRSDLTYALDLVRAGTMTLTLPASCFADSVTLSTCDVANARVKTALQNNPDPSIDSADCAPSGSACVCTVVLRRAVTSETGTYSTSDASLTRVPALGLPSTRAYCRADAATMHELALEPVHRIAIDSGLSLTQAPGIAL